MQQCICPQAVIRKTPAHQAHWINHDWWSSSRHYCLLKPTLTKVQEGDKIDNRCCRAFSCFLQSMFVPFVWTFTADSLSAHSVFNGSTLKSFLKQAHWHQLGRWQAGDGIEYTQINTSMIGCSFTITWIALFEKHTMTQKITHSTRIHLQRTFKL